MSGVDPKETDISAQKRAEEIAGHLAAVVQSAAEAIIANDLKGIVRTWNAGAEKIFGYTAEEIIGRHISVLNLPDHTDEVPAILKLISMGQHIEQLETRRMRKDGTLIPVSLTFSPIKDGSGRIVGVSKIAHDITERKNAEERIRHQNIVFQGINRIFLDALTCDTEEELGRACLSVSEEVTQSKSGFILEIGADGFLHDIAISDPGWEFCKMYDKSGYRRPPGDFKIDGLYGRVLLKGKSFFTNDPYSHPDSISTPEGHPPLKAFLGTPLISGDKTIGMLGMGNREGGYRSEDVEALETLGSAIVQVFMRKRAEAALKRAHDELELQVLQRTSELSAANEELFAQLEERKLAENRISRLNRFYAVLSKVNEAIVRSHDSEELFDQVCRIAVEDGQFRMAWIGLIEPDSRRVNPVASYGDTEGYLEDLKVYAADVPEGKGPTGTAVSKCKYSISGDIENDPRMLPWRDKALQCGLRSSSAFPIYAGSSVIGALTVYSHEPQFFTGEEIQLFTSLAEDVSFALDVMASEKKRQEAEEALRIINQELELRIALRTADLEAANKELEAFSYSVSHDLRAPLRHVSGFTEMLLRRMKDHPDEKISSCADSILAASKRMGLLIDDLLAFSHIGRREMEKRKVNLNTIVRGVVRDIQEDLKERKIKWEIGELPDVPGDQSLIRLVIFNLVSNAVKFTSTRPEAEIRIGCKDDEDKFTCFVADNGVGFDMKYADKLFGVFQRLHTQDEFEGTGIGLANVQRIISRHGGRVWAEGIVEQGATFYFTLPKTKET